MTNDSPSTPRSFYRGSRSYVVIATFFVVAAILALPIFSGSASSSKMKIGQGTSIRRVNTATTSPYQPSPGLPGLNFLTSPPSGVTVDTFAGDCSTSKHVYNLQDTDLAVCASFTGATPGWTIIWSNAKSIAVQTNNVTAANGTATFTLSQSSSLGDWRVILFEPFGGTVQTFTPFTVIDADNPKADVSVSKGALSSATSAGGQVLFSVQVTNAGPNDAATLQLADVVPDNTSFVSFDQLSGPTFSCISPNVGETGTTNCSIASLARGETAIFVATYQVAAVPSSAAISSAASATSSVPDPDPDNNSSTVDVEVVNTPCQLSAPSDVTVNADAGQSGAVVTYTTPTGTGDCGQAGTGENGEPIPAISCNPASGSFFPVGSTTVICTAATGNAVSFQVTVENPGALSISLNGATSVTIECGTDFSDPGASAVNGTGQSIPVTVQYSPNTFNPDAPIVGTYTATYTATEDPNSVSTTREIIVSDNEAPTISIEGANPYRIITNSCTPFVDPGASALDGCAGPKAVTSSISGPGGATSVNNAVPGTYTITYRATDGSHEATATRTVLVGNFNEDESDQTASSNQPPTITLNGDAQITIECGTPFTDPGATATVCGGSINVTTTGTVNIHAPGTYSITYSATANNQTAETTRIVNVEADNTAPTIEVIGANPMTVECHTSFTDPGATAHDACAGDFAATPSGTVNPDVVGQYVITYNATDPSGHSATPVTRTVNVVDTTPPVVTPPANVTVNTGSGAISCGTTVSDATLGTASANDSCAGPLTVTRSGVPAGNAFPVGTTTITYSANDGHNIGTATQTVTVIDNTPPAISCPANITLEPTCPSGAIATYTAPVGQDNCPGSTTTRTAGLASGSVFPIGTTTVTHTVTDASGNTASCSFTVTVLTPQAVIQNMINTINGLPLSGSQRQGLISKLTAASDAITQGKTNVACNKLSDFISQVTSFMGNGNLTSAQGQPLINSANHIRNTIGCTNLGCT